MAKGNRNKKCEKCGRRHNQEKECKEVPSGEQPPQGGEEETK